MGLQSFVSKWKNIDFIDLAIDVLLELEDDIVQLNQEQIYIGQRSDGERITPEYTEYTKFLKFKKGQPNDRVTLLDTGDFYDSILINIVGESLIFDATDPKTPDLLEKYGENIFGLNVDRINDLRAIFYPIYIERIKQALA